MFLFKYLFKTFPVAIQSGSKKPGYVLVLSSASRLGSTSAKILAITIFEYTRQRPLQLWLALPLQIKQLTTETYLTKAGVLPSSVDSTRELYQL